MGKEAVLARILAPWGLWWVSCLCWSLFPEFSVSGRSVGMLWAWAWGFACVPAVGEGALDGCVCLVMMALCYTPPE